MREIAIPYLGGVGQQLEGAEDLHLEGRDQQLLRHVVVRLGGLLAHRVNVLVALAEELGAHRLDRRRDRGREQERLAALLVGEVPDEWW